MRTKHENQRAAETDRSTVLFFAGLILGIGFGAGVVYLGVVSTDSISENQTASGREESICSVDASATQTKPIAQPAGSASLDAATIKNAILAAQTAAREQERADESETEPRGLKQKDSQRMEEMRVLRQALPENGLLPVPKTEEERLRERENSQDEINIRGLMIEGRATEVDLKDYYDLKSKRFRDEIALLDFCDKNIRSATSAGNSPLGYCIDLQATGIAARREANERALATLEQAYQNGFPQDRQPPIKSTAAEASSMPNPESREERKPFGGQNQSP